jgi:2,3-bisphosphoglycerate-dependent phosphoglycerate mutase
MAGKLIVARHHESEWNRLGRWTGQYDCHLDGYGFEKSLDMGRLLGDVRIDCAFTSALVRTIETCSCIINVCKCAEVPVEHAEALNERDYGDYTGKNKWDMEAELGEEEFQRMHRGWDYPIPNGESLARVYERVIPYFLENVLPKVNEEKTVLVVAHGNSLRTLVKYIEGISDDGIAEIEISFGQILIYELDGEGRMVRKEVRQTESSVPA